MLALNITTDLKRFTRQLNDLERRQVRFAAARALNDVGDRALGDLKVAMQRVFVNPKPYTLNAVRRVPAHRDNLATTLAIKDRGPAGQTAPASFLSAEILGGQRHIKRFEAAIDGIGGVTGMELIPGRGAKLDRYGNVPSATIRSIIASLRASPADKVAGAGGKRRRARNVALIRHREVTAWIVRSRGGGAPLGIWGLKSPGHVAPVLFFARSKPDYSRRFDFSSLVVKSYNETFMQSLSKRFVEALATAK